MTVFLFILISAVFAGISFKMRWLSLSGSMTAAAFGFCLLWFGGLQWILPVLVFFGSSSLLSKIERGRSADDPGKKREDIRSSIQVLANGGVAWLFLFRYAMDQDPLWYAGFIGALAAATSDTWATEIGRLAGGHPRHILTGKTLERHASGGVTWQGTAGSFAGGALIGMTCLPFYDGNFIFCITFGCISGAVGSLFDSILGASLQAKYRDTFSGRITEKPVNTSESTLIQGWKWMTNDVVNVFCTAIGSLIAISIAG